MKVSKIKGTLLIAVLLLTTLAIATQVSAANHFVTLDLEPSSGYVGDLVNATGKADAYVPIDIFWDYVKIAETTADGSGNYLKEITIPEDFIGTHTVAAKDTFHSTLGEDVFTIKPKITVTPSSGLPLDTFIVAGTGFAAESDIELFFNSTACMLQIKNVNATSEWSDDEVNTGDYSVHLETIGDVGAGTEGRIVITMPDGFTLGDLDTISWWIYTVAGYPAHVDITLDVDGDSVVDYEDMLTAELAVNNPGYSGLGLPPHGNYSIWLKTFELAADDGYGVIDDTTVFWVTKMGGGDLNAPSSTLEHWKDGTVDTDPESEMTTPVINSSAPVLKLEIEVDNWIPAAANPEAYIDDIMVNGVVLGLEPPVEEDETDVLGSFEATLTVPADIDYANYLISAMDASGNYNTTEFEVTATISLDPEDGASGTVVDISGIGFNGTKVSISFGLAETLLKKDVALTDEGTFTSSFIVPTIAIGEHLVLVKDDNEPIIDAYLKFNVTETTEITLDPIATAPDSMVTIEGTGFTAEVGVEVNVDVGPLMDYLTYLTNSTGGFKETFLMPSFIPQEYTLNATDENGLTAVALINVAVTELTLDLEEGPTGMLLKVDGSGFSDGMEFNLTFNDEYVDTGTIVDGDLSMTFTVPTVPVGFYTVKVVDELEISGTATFEVNATTTITVDPSTALVGYEIELEGAYFSAESEVTILLQNSTWSKPLITVLATVTTKTNGTFACTFVVPELELGDYVVNATDALGLVATTTLTVVESIYVEVSTSSPEYLAGDSVSFYVKAAFPFVLELVITDPMGYPFTTVGPIPKAEWVVMGDYVVIPTAKTSFELPSYAITGLWKYEAYDGTEMVANGTFVVTGEAPEPQPDLPAETTGEEPLDSTGAPKSSFVLGEMVLASAEITNAGTESQPMLIAVQWTDPDYRTLAPIFMLTTLSPGQSFVFAPGLILPTTGYATGTWTATILVFDAWPALGGVTIGEPVTITITVS